MPIKNSKRLVIDTSVISACGGKDATHPTSKDCRDFLQKVLEISHQAVLTPDMQQEWDRHQSGFVRSWRVAMVARKKLYRLASPINKELRDKIEKVAANAKAHAAMLKDVH